MNERSTRAVRQAGRPGAPSSQSRRAISAQRPAPGGRRPVRRGRAGANPDRRYTLAKLALLAALVAYCALVIGANSARDVDFGAITARVSTVPGVAALDALDENAFQERLGVGPEECEGWLMRGSAEIMNVSELMIAKGGEAALDRLEDACRERVEGQLTVFRGYGEAQTELLEHAALWRRGDYLFYAVGDTAGQWEDVFLSCVR